jgi:hypothetical protein
METRVETKIDLKELKAAIDKAIIAARLAYQFGPGSYTASALSEICAVRELLNRR